MRKVRLLKILSWGLFGFGILLLVLLLNQMFEILSIVGEWWAVRNWICVLPPGLLIMPLMFIGWYLVRRVGRKMKDVK